MMSAKHESKKTASIQQQFVQIFFGIYFLVLVAMLAAYIVHFGMTISADHERWGQFGDFLGGILNPLTSFFTLLVAVLVWSLQSKELADTRTVLHEQTRINRLTFADQMLMYHFDAISSCISQINTTAYSHKRGAEKIYGDDALREVIGIFKTKGFTDFEKIKTDYGQEPVVEFALEQWTPLHNAIRVTVKYIESTFDFAGIESRLELLRLRTTLYTQLSLCYYVSFTRDSELLAISRRADLLKYFQPNKVKDWLYKKADF